MQRHIIIPRDDWQKKVESVGLPFHSLNGVYWNESACYEFTSKEVDKLEAATNKLHEMCLNAVQHIIDNNLFSKLSIPENFAQMIRESWEAEPPAIYGRFDLAYDGVNPPKLLEYNADTPTSLVEAAVVQWYWLQDKYSNRDQFNSIHERLVAKWTELKNYITEPLYFTYIEKDGDGNDMVEDVMTVAYMRDTAEQAGINCVSIGITDVGFDDVRRVFADNDGREIKSIFKLYPWEALLYDDFGPYVLETKDKVQWIEPAWKAVLSNKGILPILWEMYPGHENLLPAYFDDSKGLKRWVKKPLLSREGANITISLGLFNKEKTGGEYGTEGYIYQEYFELPTFDKVHPVIGSWVIDGESAGMGIRESDGLITGNTSRFVPHYF